MNRQHGLPLLLPLGKTAEALTQLPLGDGPERISEAELQQLIHDHPQSLPINEIDPLFSAPVPMCMELSTEAGSIDNLMITPSGLPVLVECKLWRNPQARREVVGQILDYAKELSRWSSSDLQREVARRVSRDGNPILALLKEAGHEVDEIAFNDALTGNLRRGRFLLLIVGDGIREGVEAIAEYLQIHAGLHFSLGLVELPIFLTSTGDRLVVPRVVARTQLLTRTVISVPEGQAVIDDASSVDASDEDVDPLSRFNFWSDFVRSLRFDDPAQPMPKPGRQGYVSVTLSAPGGNCWLVVYRSEPAWEVGVYLSYVKNSIGAEIVTHILEDWPTIRDELGGTASLRVDRNERRLIEDSLRTGPWTNPVEKDRALSWLRERTNTFVNILRPRVKSAVADLSRE